MMKLAKYISALAMSLCCAAAFAQQSEEPTSAQIVVRGEVHERMVMIRWAPTDAMTWRRLNKYGVRLERATLFRDGQVLNEPEVKILSGVLKPEQSEAFKLAANQYPYAAIIAQAVFGESFEVSGGNAGGVASIIAASEELEQRFAFSLHAADMCFPGAVAAGWGFEDLTVRKGERYLYRVVPIIPEGESPIQAGALFVDTERLDNFPAPLDFAGRFGDGSVILNWDGRIQNYLYAAYIPERSMDGKNFVPISETPISRMDDSEDNQRIRYIDSIANGVTYHYRLVGVTPFGTRGKVSKTISGVGRAELSDPPFITRAIPSTDGGVNIEWEFATENEALIESFTIERSEDNKTFSDFMTPIDKKQRSVVARDVPQTNYFAVTANTSTGRRLRSFPALVQLVDTLPPATPTGLRAAADTTGAVRLSWNANRDKGRFGYRIFKGQTAEDELVPLNDVAHRDTVFVDSINLNTLNSRVYYAITALDERYNQSNKTPVVTVKRPERIPPTAPLITKIEVMNGKNVVRWVSGGEENLAGYDLYRKGKADSVFVVLSKIPDRAAVQYEDADVENNAPYIYRICARSEGGLISDPSPEYSVRAIRKSAPAQKNPVTFEISASQNAIALSWNVPMGDVTNIQIYKQPSGGTIGLMTEGLEGAGKLEDRAVTPGVSYKYMLVVKSNSSAPVTVTKQGAL